MAARRPNPGPDAWPSKKNIPNWLLAKNGERPRGHCFVPQGKFSVEALASGLDLSGNIELLFARSELGWLGGPETKSWWGRFSWVGDFAQALPFQDEGALRDALKLASPSLGASVLSLSGSFAKVQLDPRKPDDVSRAVAARVEKKALEAASAAGQPKPKRRAAL